LKIRQTLYLPELFATHIMIDSQEYRPADLKDAVFKTTSPTSIFNKFAGNILAQCWD